MGEGVCVCAWMCVCTSVSVCVPCTNWEYTEIDPPVSRLSDCKNGVRSQTNTVIGRCDLHNGRVFISIPISLSVRGNHTAVITTPMCAPRRGTYRTATPESEGDVVAICVGSR